MSKLPDDKLETWFHEAKKDGLDETLVKWAFRAAQAKGALAATERELTANEADYSSMVFRIRSAVGVDSATDKQLSLLGTFVSLGRQQLAADHELLAAAETVLELLQRLPAGALASVPNASRFKK